MTCSDTCETITKVKIINKSFRPRRFLSPSLIPSSCPYILSPLMPRQPLIPFCHYRLFCIPKNILKMESIVCNISCQAFSLCIIILRFVWFLLFVLFCFAHQLLILLLVSGSIVWMLHNFGNFLTS